MKLKIIGSVLASLTLVAGVATAMADSVSTGKTSDIGTAQNPPQALFEKELPKSLSQLADEKALNQLHHVNQKEINLAQLGQDKAQSSQSKSLADRLSSEHKALDAKVESLAKARGIKLTDFQLANYEKDVLDELGKLEGARFDQAFTREVSVSQHEALKMLQLAKGQSSPSVKSLISQAIPSLEKNIAQSHSVQRGIASEPDQNK